MQAPLTVVVAPAGAGKTTLVSGWAEEQAHPVAWLSLDESGNDFVELWSCVIAALETIAPGCGDTALRLLRRPVTRVESVDQLLVNLAGLDQPRSTLVLDDIHLLGDDLVAGSVAQFVQHLPSWLHVVALSRRRLALPIQRMRSAGQIGEVHFGQLRFSPDEAAALLGRLAPGLGSAEIAAVVERADGWAASLSLAALAARSARTRVDLPANVDDWILHDYVLKELLAGETEPVVELLQASSIVPSINASLADTLTGRTDSGELLSTAEERGLFVSRRTVDGWFDVHALVREVLRVDLGNRLPDRLETLHVRAAEWFETNGEIAPALEHWLSAGHARRALRLLAEQHAALYDSGRQHLVTRTIARIAPDVASGDVDAMVDYAWCHILVDRRRYLDLIEHLTFTVQTTAPSDLTRARVLVLRSAAAVMDGRWSECATLCRQALTILGHAWFHDPIGRFVWNHLARDVALSERWSDTAAEVQELLGAVTPDPGRRIAYEGTRAVGQALAGRPIEALNIVAGIRTMAAVAEMTILRAELDVAEALARREIGDHQRALLRIQALAEEPAETMLFCRIRAAVELVELHLDDGDLGAAAHAFELAQELVEGARFGEDGRSWLSRCGARLALSSGQVLIARRWTDEISDPFWRSVSDTRILLATSDLDGARNALARAAPRCPRHEVTRSLLMAQMVAHPAEQLDLVASGVGVAVRHGMLQTVASEGPAIVELAGQVALAPMPWLDRLRRAAALSERPVDATRLRMVEPLTDRECEVLRFLPSRLTNGEIADQLYISANTIKFHLKLIYRKLGVNSRSEAATIARAITRRPDQPWLDESTEP